MHINTSNSIGVLPKGCICLPENVYEYKNTRQHLLSNSQLEEWKVMPIFEKILEYLNITPLGRIYVSQTWISSSLVDRPLQTWKALHMRSYMSYHPQSIFQHPKNPVSGIIGMTIASATTNLRLTIHIHWLWWDDGLAIAALLLLIVTAVTGKMLFNNTYVSVEYCLEIHNFHIFAQNWPFFPHLGQISAPLGVFLGSGKFPHLPVSLASWKLELAPLLLVFCMVK